MIRYDVRRGGPGRRLRPLILATLLLFVSTGCGEHTPVLKDLTGLEELKSRFNRDRGRPRIVLLLSPT